MQVVRRWCIMTGRARRCHTCSRCNQTFKGPLTKQTFSVTSCLVAEQASKQSERSSTSFAHPPVCQNQIPVQNPASGLQTCQREQLCCVFSPPRFRISGETEEQSSVLICFAPPFFFVIHAHEPLQRSMQH